MEITSYETAKRLKEAGFPQPAPKEGQFWYGLIQRQDEPIYIFLDRGSFHDRYGNYHKKEAFEKFGTSAPTATDIMKALGEKYVLWYDNSPKMQMWFCAKTADLPHETQEPFSHTNSAEAAALALLDKRRNN